MRSYRLFWFYQLCSVAMLAFCGYSTRYILFRYVAENRILTAIYLYAVIFVLIGVFWYVLVFKISLTGEKLPFENGSGGDW